MLRRIRASACSRALLCAGVLALAAGCTEGRDPVSLPGGDARLVLRPLFHAQGTSADALPVNVARLSILEGSTVLHTVEARINPNAQSWSLPAEFPLNAATAAIVARIELIYEAGTQRVIEWSGETPPLQVKAGENSEASVLVGRGPAENLAVTSVAIVEPSEETLEGDSLHLTPTVAGTTDAKVYWRSLTPDVALVGDNGIALMLQPGTARIEAHAGQRSDTLTVSVLPRPVYITIAPNTLLLESIGAELEPITQAKDARDNVIPARGISITVADSSIVRVNGRRLQARRNGVTAVTFRTVGRRPAELTVPVHVEQRATQLRVEPASIRFTRLNSTVQLTAIATDSLGTIVPNAQVSWGSAAPGVVLVEPNGVARSTGNGTARVIAAAGFSSAEVEAVVRQVPASVRLPADTLPVSIGTTPRLPVLALDSSGVPIPPNLLTWTLANPAIATVAADGLVTPRFPGVGRLIVGVPNVAADTALLAITTHACPALMTAQPNSFGITTRGGYTHEDFTNTTNNGTFKGQSVIYSGGIMYGTSTGDVVTSWDYNGRFFDLRESGVCVLNAAAPFHSITAVAAAAAVTGPQDVAVIEEILAWNEPGHSDYVLFRYTIANLGSATVSGLHFGKAYDFDMPHDGSPIEIGRWNNALSAAEVVNRDSIANPQIIGLMPVGPGVTGYAFVGTGGFLPATRGAYYSAMSGGIRAPAVSTPTDVRQLIGVGGITLAPGERRVLYYALVGGDNRAQFNASAAAARARAQQLGF